MLVCGNGEGDFVARPGFLEINSLLHGNAGLNTQAVVNSRTAPLGHVVMGVASFQRVDQIFKYSSALLVREFQW
jgi:hypothetical protein